MREQVTAKRSAKRATTRATIIGALASLIIACGGGSDSDTDAAPNIDADNTPDAAPDATPVRCDQLAALPISATTLNGFSGSEDFAFDADGDLLSTDSSGNLTRQGKTGARSLVVPNLGETAGTAFLPNGDLVIANVGDGAINLINSAGSRSTILANIAYPNGLAVSQAGLVYVAEHDAGRVLELDPTNGNMTPIATGLVNPNGLSFSPDYQTLYVGSFGGGTVHRLERSGATWGAPILHGNINSGIMGGGLDGVAVDACGNVYVTEFIEGKIWRIPADGGAPVEAANLNSSWIPNMHWGAGVGGWSRDILYVMDRDQGRVFELDFGVGEKPIVFP